MSLGSAEETVGVLRPRPRAGRRLVLLSAKLPPGQAVSGVVGPYSETSVNRVAKLDRPLKKWHTGLGINDRRGLVLKERREWRDRLGDGFSGVSFGDNDAAVAVGPEVVGAELEPLRGLPIAEKLKARFSSSSVVVGCGL